MQDAFYASVKGVRVSVVRGGCAQICCQGTNAYFQKIEGNGVVFLGVGPAPATNRSENS